MMRQPLPPTTEGGGARLSYLQADVVRLRPLERERALLWFLLQSLPEPPVKKPSTQMPILCRTVRACSVAGHQEAVWPRMGFWDKTYRGVWEACSTESSHSGATCSNSAGNAAPMWSVEAASPKMVLCRPYLFLKVFKAAHTSLKCNYFHVCSFLCFIFISVCEMLTYHLSFSQILGRLKGPFSAPDLLNLRGCLTQVSLNHATLGPLDRLESFRHPSTWGGWV